MTDYRTQRTEDVVTHSEQASFPSLTIVNLKNEASAVQQAYKNFVLLNLNGHCVRMAVMQGEYLWHQHPRSDECFLVLEGELEIDLRDGRTFRLKTGEHSTFPAGTIQRSRSRTRAVNLCFEDQGAYIDVVFEDNPASSWGSIEGSDWRC